VGSSVFNTPSFAAFSSLVHFARSRRLLSAPRWHFAKIARQPWAPLWGSYLLLRRRENRGGYFGLHAHFEQPPRPENRIRLAEERDELGLPRAEVHWGLGDDELRSLRRTYELIGAELDAAGIATLKPALPRRLDEPLHNVTHHHMGTTRMHIDPKHGVVDENSRVHGLANLFVAGSSVFPTGGAATVTLTLVAMTIRLGDHLKRELAGKELIQGPAAATTARAD
jgi:choline dehydrogenase-like flavoprotein